MRLPDGVVLGGLASAVALWLGLTAPAVSPVAPAPAAPSAGPTAQPSPAAALPVLDGRRRR